MTLCRPEAVVLSPDTKQGWPRFFPLTTLLCLTFLTASCVVPVPHRRVHVNGIEARVVDASDQTPVVGARIAALHDQETLSETDADGRFVIEPVHGWHGAYLVGPVSYSLFPHFDMPSPRPPFQVEAPGYEIRTVAPYEAFDGRREADEKVIRLKPAS